MRQFGGQQGVRSVLLSTVAAAMFCAGTSLAQDAASPPDSTTPDTRQACLANHEQAQVKRIEKKLVAARNAARACAVTACPAAVRSDCTEWVSELSKLIPTLLLVAESASGELENVKVTLDGVPFTEKLDGTALEVEPGPHFLHFEYRNEPPIDRRVDVPEGEKSLMVRVRFAGEPLPAQPVPLAPSPPRTEPVPREPGERPIPLLTYIFGGLAVVSAGTSAVVAAGAFSERSAASDECAPNCDAERVDAIHNRFLLADIAGGVALASAGLATYFYFTRPEVQKEHRNGNLTPFLGVAKRGRGLELSAGGRF
jgi:hypothetical protein